MGRWWVLLLRWGRGEEAGSKGTVLPFPGVLPLRLCPLHPVRLLPLQPQLHRDPPQLHGLPLPGGVGVHHHAEPQRGESAPQGEGPWGRQASGATRGTGPEAQAQLLQAGVPPVPPTA